uniref:Peptidase M12A domain-containing protein n=1 Tax=Hucho hucho TaxID=62062 RepID=A0A4W5M898_9TELE
PHGKMCRIAGNELKTKMSHCHHDGATKMGGGLRSSLSPMLLEKANKDVVSTHSEPMGVDDIAYDNDADPCTSRGCMWPKSSDSKVYMPYTITNRYSSREKSIIERGLQSFDSFSCINFVKRNNHRDYLSIPQRVPLLRWLSRQRPDVSLARSGLSTTAPPRTSCLHALGFNHEQNNNDSGMEHNFRKIATLNQGTGYDYISIMQYHKYAFSKNNKPTMAPIPNLNGKIGKLSQMSQRDNRL